MKILKAFLHAVTLVLTGCAFDATSTNERPSQLSGVSSVKDAVGDFTAAARDSSPYMDVVSAKVQQRKDGTLSFFMELAGAIPDTPTQSSLIWPFHVDTDPNSSPCDPCLYVDHIVRVLWNGAFVGQVVDRSTGQVAEVPFEIHGGTVRLTVDPSLLGNPPSFGWNAATRPSTSVPYSDFAPDCFTCLVTWTAK